MLTASLNKTFTFLSVYITSVFSIVHHEWKQMMYDWKHTSYNKNVFAREGSVLFNDALNTFYLRLYGVGHMEKDHSDSKRGNPLPPHGYSFRLTARVLLYAQSHRQDNTYHGLCYTSREVVLSRPASVIHIWDDSFILKKDPPPQCILTVCHILECNHLARTKNYIFGRCGVVESFQFHPELVFKILRDSEFYSKF